MTKKTTTDLIAVWKDTMTYFDLKKISVLPSIKYKTDQLNDPLIKSVCDKPDTKQNLISSDSTLGFASNKIIVINSDTFNLAIHYVQQGYSKPLVLNMASALKPGGGVANGKTAQEEELFRRSNAHQTHPKYWYPLKTNDVIYSPEVIICKNSREANYKNIDEVNVAMITCPAIKNPKLINSKYSSDDYKIMFDKIESIFKIGIINGHDCLVLGALGCGVYSNPPLEVAEIFSIMIKKYEKHFAKIGFAIMVVKDSDKVNLDTFKKIIQ